VAHAPVGDYLSTPFAPGHRGCSIRGFRESSLLAHRKGSLAGGQTIPAPVRSRRVDLHLQNPGQASPVDD
jgi:hypothetical protein